jgi:hypothetical protein
MAGKLKISLSMQTFYEGDARVGQEKKKVVAFLETPKCIRKAT